MSKTVHLITAGISAFLLAAEDVLLAAMWQSGASDPGLAGDIC